MEPFCQITEILMAYVRFLVENPHFRSLLMGHVLSLLSS